MIKFKKIFTFLSFPFAIVPLLTSCAEKKQVTVDPRKAGIEFVNSQELNQLRSETFPSEKEYETNKAKSQRIVDSNSFLKGINFSWDIFNFNAFDEKFDLGTIQSGDFVTLRTNFDLDSNNKVSDLIVVNPGLKSQYDELFNEYIYLLKPNIELAKSTLGYLNHKLVKPYIDKAIQLEKLGRSEKKDAKKAIIESFLAFFGINLSATHADSNADVIAHIESAARAFKTIEKNVFTNFYAFANTFINAKEIIENSSGKSLENKFSIWSKQIDSIKNLIAYRVIPTILSLGTFALAPKVLDIQEVKEVK